jgi:hypothetical protein
MSNTPVPPKFGERLGGVNFASDAPIQKFRDIDPTLPDLGFVNPDVRHLQLGSQLTLGQIRCYPHPAQHRRQIAVSRGVLGLGHAGHCPPD